VRYTRIIVTHYGGPDALQVVEDECPEPKRREVRVRVLDGSIHWLLGKGTVLPDHTGGRSGWPASISISPSVSRPKNCARI